MDSKFNKNISCLVAIGAMLMFVYAKCNNKVNSPVNAFVVEQTNDWQKIKLQSVDTVNCIKTKLQFLNNPYSFDGNNDLAIYINQTLLMRGSFESSVDLCLPIKFLGDRVLPAITIYDGQRAYNFIHKKSFFLNSDDKYLYVVFCPENELTESCYMFSQKGPIL